MNSFFAALCAFFFGGSAPLVVDLSKPLPLVETTNNACLPGEKAFIELPKEDGARIAELQYKKRFITIPQGGTTIGCCGIIESVEEREQSVVFTGTLIERIRCLAIHEKSVRARSWPLSFNEKTHRAPLALLVIELRDHANATCGEMRQNDLEEQFRTLLTKKPTAAFFIASLYASEGLLKQSAKRELLESPNLILMLKGLIHHLYMRGQEETYPPEVQGMLESLKAEMNNSPPGSQEFALLKKRYELIKQFPTSKEPPTSIPFESMKTILDEGHLGMAGLKEHILDYLAVLTLNPNASAPILCLAGPAGVGKTTIAQSIARALNRPFYRISLGGFHDESLLRGSSPSYVGSQPGRVALSILKTHSYCPLILLDEIDKIAKGTGTNGGSPEAALLELLDPAQNNAFHDNYLGFGVDLKKVLFVATANELDKLQKPLLDRLEIITVPGYSLEEKIKILKEMVLPQQCKEFNIDPALIQFDEPALKKMAKLGNSEPGMRKLQHLVRRLCAKVARLILEQKPIPRITTSFVAQLEKA